MPTEIVSVDDEGPASAVSARASTFHALAPGPLRELGIALKLVALVSVARGVLGALFPGLGVFSMYFSAILLAA